MPPTQANPNDPDVIALSKAIIQHESGGDFNAVGDAGTSHGAAQWQPGTWKAHAQEVLGDPNAQMTPENQKAVLAGVVAKDKASGLNPAQIAAKWNSGSPDGWENKIGTTNINGQQIKYNVPKYVKDVTDLYHTYKGQGGAQGYNPQPFSNPETPGQFDFSGAQTNQPAPEDTSLGGKLHGRLQQGATALQQAAGGQINPFSGVLQTAGAGAGAIGDVTGAALELIPGVKQVEGVIGQGAQALAQTQPGQAVVKGVSDFTQAHPELAGDIGAVGNIASVLPIGKGVGMLKEAAGRGIAKATGKGALDATIEAVSPSLTAGAAAKQAARQGLTKSPLTGKITASIGNDVHDLAKVVNDNVPGFDQLKTVTDKLNATRDAKDALAEKLKQEVVASGQDRIYPFKELESRMMNAEEPISLRGTPFEKQIKPIKKAALQIAKEKGGTISSLFDARKEFDQLVSRTYPNLYTRADAPMRSAIKTIRDTMNSFIEEKLPPGSGFSDKLLVQHQLFNAIENMAPKAVKEIGTTNISRFAGKHPIVSGLLKTAGKGVVEGTGAGAALRTMGVGL